MRNVGRIGVVAIVFIVGAIVGRLTCGADDRRRAPPVDYFQSLEVRRADGSHTWLVPVRVCADGKEEQLRPVDGAPLCVVWYVTARVQVSYIEQPDPERRSP